MIPLLKKPENPKFKLGRLVVTSGVAFSFDEDPLFGNFVSDSLQRHVSGDWGDMEAGDKKENDLAVQSGELRIFSAYEYERPGGQGQWKVWIITEADRSATTILFPDEY